MTRKVNLKKVYKKGGALFWQKGYHSTSMRDIAIVCKCKPANIYNYFASKEDILYEVILDITEQTVSSIKHLEDDGLAGLHAREVIPAVPRVVIIPARGC